MSVDTERALWWTALTVLLAAVSDGTAATKDEAGASRTPVLKLVARLTWWNPAPNGRHATFLNVWAGRRRRSRFATRLREDLTEVFQLLAQEKLTAQVAARYPLDEAAGAMQLAESRTAVGKVVLLPPRAGS